jgi:hypothetical protein
MLNTEEVTYNAKSLVSAWLDGKKDIKGLLFKLTNDSDESKDTIGCTLDNCGEELARILMNNGGVYNLVELYGTVKGERKLLGSLDII